jgi:serine/threonine protein kinase
VTEGTGAEQNTGTESATGVASETPEAGLPARFPGPDYLVAGRYRLRSKIGGGGMGAVWLARDERLGRDVAAKQVISTAGMTEEQARELRERTQREGRIAARLGHRSAIAMYDVALDRGEPWLVMEYLPSRSLAQVLHMTGTLPAEQVAQIGAQIADALAAAHTAGITHRDVKPGNILIANTGRAAGSVKLTDFGIARAKDDTSAVPAGVITGTPAYFAPEVARGGDPSEKSDLYSLGATLYTAVEGVPPFGIQDDSIALLHKVARGEIDPPKTSGPLMTVILSMLEPNPSRRPGLLEARDRLAAVAAAGGNPAAVLAGPLRATDGAPPIWVRNPGAGRSGPSNASRSGAANSVGSAGAVGPRVGAANTRRLTARDRPAGQRPRPDRTPVNHPTVPIPTPSSAAHQQLYVLPEKPPLTNTALALRIGLGVLAALIIIALLILLFT